ncbi:MAG: histone deacetylase [Acidobacteria bacterium]|nr:histone deacetylase [Acidobacteriota bacterium]
MIVVLDPLFSRHDPGAGHPERPERIGALLEMLQAFRWRNQIDVVTPRAGSWRQAAWVHSDDYLGLLKRTSGLQSILDPDTRTSAESVEVALAAMGSVVAVAARMADTGRAGFAMIRPPGHHAEAGRAMGFCLLNNVAIAAEWALREAGARRVAVIDFDVHHGNGTQISFYHRDDVLYLSTHQFPFYPGSGAMDESGTGRGESFTVNFPLAAGSGDAAFTRIYEEIAPRMLEQYCPDWILVSAGYDAHRDDPLAHLQVTLQGFARVVQSLQRCAAELCGGRILYLLEGGYNLHALADSVRISLEVILGKVTPEPVPLPPPAGWEDYLSQCHQFHARWHL